MSLPKISLQVIVHVLCYPHDVLLLRFDIFRLNFVVRHSYLKFPIDTSLPGIASHLSRMHTVQVRILANIYMINHVFLCQNDDGVYKLYVVKVRLNLTFAATSAIFSASVCATFQNTGRVSFPQTFLQKMIVHVFCYRYLHVLLLRLVD